MLDIIKKRSTFLEVRKSGEAFFSKNLILQKQNTPVFSPQFGFTVSKKVGCAVVRNTIKRRLKHITSNLVKDKPIDGSFYVIIARKYCSKAEFKSLNKEIIELLDKSRSFSK